MSLLDLVYVLYAVPFISAGLLFFAWIFYSHRSQKNAGANQVLYKAYSKTVFARILPASSAIMVISNVYLALCETRALSVKVMPVLYELLGQPKNLTDTMTGILSLIQTAEGIIILRLAAETVLHTELPNVSNTGILLISWGMFGLFTTCCVAIVFSGFMYTILIRDYMRCKWNVPF